MSALTNATVSILQECYVCHKNDTIDNLMKPCLCPNHYVHPKCLSRFIRNEHTSQIMTARNGDTFNCSVCPQCHSNLCIKLGTCSWFKWIKNLFTKWQFKLVRNMFVSAFGILYHSVGVILLLELFIKQIKKIIPKSWPIKKLEDGIEIKLRFGEKSISLKKIIWIVTWFSRVLFLLIFSASNFLNVSQYTTKLKLSMATQMKMFKIKLDIELYPPENQQ